MIAGSRYEKASCMTKNSTWNLYDLLIQMKSLNTPILIHTVLLGLTISVDYFVGSVISLNLYELSTLIAYLRLLKSGTI